MLILDNECLKQVGLNLLKVFTEDGWKMANLFIIFLLFTD